MNKQTKHHHEIVICEFCKGEGFTTSHNITDYHKNEYEVIKHGCGWCNNTGRRFKKTTIEFTPFGK